MFRKLLVSVRHETTSHPIQLCNRVTYCPTRSNFELAVWVVVIATLIGLTAKDSFNLAIDFHKREPITSVDVVTNFTLWFPNIAICAPIDWVYKGVNLTYAKVALQKNPQTPEHRHMVIMMAYMTLFMDFLNFNSVDGLQAFYDTMDNEGLNHGMFSDFIPDDKFSLLLDAVALYWCNKISPILKTTKITSENILCNNPENCFSAQNNIYHFCGNLSSKPIPDYYQFYRGKFCMEIPVSFDKNTKWLELLVQNKISVFSGPYISEMMMRPQVTTMVEMGQAATFNWAIKAQYILLNTGHCAPESSEQLCQVRCMAQVFLEVCGCWPFSLRKIRPTPKVAYCSLIHYQNCSEAARGKAYRKCWTCALCVYTYDDWQIRTVSEYEVPNKAQIILQSDARSFPQFIQRHPYSTEAFIAQLGGIAGLYLGASYLTVFSLFMIGTKWIIQMWRTSDSTEVETQLNLLIWSGETKVKTVADANENTNI